LADWGGFHHQSIYLAEARHLGIEVRPPHVNHSLIQFVLSWEKPPAAGEKTLHPTLWMGMGQVRDLRRSSIQAILAARRDRSFTSVGDLLSRVALARKEWTHLIQCGALDGLGESRAALLAEASATQASGDGGQLAFTFVAQAVAAEDASQRVQWETKLLGQPVSLHPLATVDPAHLPAMKLHEVHNQPGSSVTVAGTRLPGWTGGKGWYCGDSESYTVAIPAKGMTNPRPWRPILLRGRWCSDGWGDGWIQIDEWHLLE
jgi:DNA polymerase III alpha subunit